MIGFALLKKDKLTGKKFWITWGEQKTDEVIFSEGQPLTFPPDQLQVGTRVHLLSPKD